MSRRKTIPLCAVAILAGALAGGARAEAGLLPVDVPGVALVWAAPVHPPEWVAVYGNDLANGRHLLDRHPLAGPISGNHLRATVAPDAKTVTFDEPLTLMLPGFPEQWIPSDPTRQSCTYGFGRSQCTARYGTFCGIAISGGPGPDTIIVRHSPREFGCDTYVASGNSNDVVDARDGTRSHVSCGLRYDTVLAEPGDEIAGDCESVTGL